ncbi:molybdenum cofactor guanylyltransferase [Synechococcus sp. CCY9201]|uniref:molybdenum cofactor guanylyltransferase n=1 Tax=Synechococcus sp. CCY9201 TaxID=174697 RepID=UPI002B205E78|nr:molybdenum cofactor guanylyltransferase [Synechococcus sp. CCY9201]MEA5475531.1 molybdenum cofactor guanylyltransferase [Synechococcus sp. CCY9201]
MLRSCLLSGGDSHRMGRDKALLPHPAGGTWLERGLRRLAALEQPITLCSRHSSHLALAAGLAQPLGVPLDCFEEPPPWRGPLRALARLMHRHPDDAILLLMPVDMPWLETQSLRQLLEAADQHPHQFCLAHDGQRLQPLLGVYPNTPTVRRDLEDWLALGHRRLQGWLDRQPVLPVRLEPSQLRNCNHPHDWPHDGPAARPDKAAGP